MNRLILIAAVGVFALSSCAGGAKPASSTPTNTTTAAQGSMTCASWTDNPDNAIDRNSIAAALLEKYDVEVTIGGSARLQSDLDELCAKLPHSKLSDTAVAAYLIKLHKTRYSS